MKRAVILVGYEGSGQNFLAGVSADLQRYRSFFTSVNGGAWYNSEIHEGLNWSSDSLLNTIRSLINEGTEYIAVFFSGHGFTSQLGTTYFELNDDEAITLNQLQGALNTVKSLIVADSCRVMCRIIEKAQREPQIRMFARGGAIRWAEYRESFDNGVARLRSGHWTVALSTDLNQAAEDSSEGGIYSKALLDVAQNTITSGTSGIFSIESVHDVAAKRVGQITGETQTPVIVKNEIITPPFLIIL